MDLNLDFSLTGLDGQKLPDSHVGEIVANALFFAQEKQNALKFHAWAMDLHARKTIALDAQDDAVFRVFVETMNIPVVTYISIINAMKTD